MEICKRYSQGTLRPARSKTNENLKWQEWLTKHFPRAVTAPFGPRHVRLWEWFEALQPGVKPRPRVEVWPRGGAKSMTAELAAARLAVTLKRRYVLYVSGTQDQADRHVASIATLMERAGIPRLLNVYGSSKGWRRQELRTANGFNVSACGLETAMRGVKLDEYRPDLIIFDDIDSNADSTRTIEKKVNAITTAIMPAGSPDVAVLVIQNKIHEESIVNSLCENRADFLHGREAAFIEPAVTGLRYEPQADGDGVITYRIVEGAPTWAGQDLAVCENQLNEWGAKAFEREAQHNVEIGEGYVFDVSNLNYCDAHEVPDDLDECRAWDLAATEGAGDWTVGGRVGRSQSTRRIYVIHVERGQWEPNGVKQHIKECARADGRRVKLRLPQDPAQAGKAQRVHHEEEFEEFNPVFKPVIINKVTNATGFAGEVNKGNVWFVRAPWNFAVKEVLRKFRENVADQMDDDVDALSDAYNEVSDAWPEMKTAIAGRPIRKEVSEDEPVEEEEWPKMKVAI